MNYGKKYVLFYEITSISNEDVYEHQSTFWSRFQKEIILKQNIQLGSAGEIIPDIEFRGSFVLI